MHSLFTSEHLLLQAVSGSKRLALIIGNSNYGSFQNLENPENDALGMREMLKSLGFAVDDILNVDRNRHEMLMDIEEFTEHIHEDTTDIVFYYAGHGCGISKYTENELDL